MQKAINKKVVTVLIIALAASLAAAAFRVYLLVNCIEPDTGLYRQGTTLGAYFNVAVILIFALMAVGTLFLTKVKAPLELKSESTYVIFSSSLCGFLFLTVLGFGLYKVYVGAQVGVIYWIQMLLCLPCMFNFFSVCSKELRERNAVQTLLSLFPALFYALRIIQAFMDVTTQMNASQHVFELVTMCAAMLFFVCETGFFLPASPDYGETEEQHASSSLVKYFGTGIFTVSLVILTVLPHLTVCAFWIYNTEFLLMDILDACIGLYALTRLMSLSRS